MKKTAKKNVKAVSVTVNKAGLPITDVGSRLHTKYKDVVKFLKENQVISFKGFDYAAGRDLILCTFLRSADLDSINKTAGDIRRALPHLVSIFNRPVIHLKDAEVVLPLDAVKRVNHQSIRHLALHTDDWRNIDKHGGVMPKRLLTKVHEDDFSIYENVVFYHLIEKILNYLKKRIYRLSEILETLGEAVKFDNFGKTNHASYYLAIGKLYFGFHKYDNSGEISEALENITKLYRQISAYKTRDVYTKNMGAKPIVGGIKKTNILSMHKDYKHVYTLFKAMDKRMFAFVLPGISAEQIKSQQYYERFCGLITVFAVSHFNFLPYLSDNVINDGKADARFKFKNWTVKVSVKYEDLIDGDIIALTVKHKKKSVSYALIPTSYYIEKNKKTEYKRIIERMIEAKFSYNKYIFLEPFDFDGGSNNSYSLSFLSGKKRVCYAILPVSIAEVNSFRRIQKILLEGMVYVAEKYDVCAFCGEAVSMETGQRFFCQKCRMAVLSINCVNCREKFTATYFDSKKTKLQKEESAGYFKYMPEFFRQEAEHKFRSITKIKDKNFICPYCDGENVIVCDSGEAVQESNFE